jgi:hypothetical protein
LRYLGSRVFTLLFLMLKLSGTSSGKNNKSCRIFHNETNKIEFAFLCSFYVFLRIFKDAAIHHYYWRWSFAPGSLKRKQTLQCGPWGAVDGAGDEIPTDYSDGVGRGSCGEGLGLARDRLEPELAVEVAGGGARGGTQRRRPQRAELRRGVQRGGAVRGGGSSSGS